MAFQPMLSSTAWRLGVPASVAGVGIVAGGVGLSNFKDDGNAAYFPWAALLFTSAVVLLLFVVFDRVARRRSPANRQPYGWVNAILGADGRVSTSRAQVFVWTLGVSTALVYLSGVAIFSVAHPAEGLLEQTDWNDYLILLGGPFAAGVLARFVVTTKVQEGNLQKTVLSATADQGVTGPRPAGPTPADGVPTAADTITNDAGELDLVDCQYLIFNLVALIYVFGVFISQIIDQSGVVDEAARFSLPDVPPVLLALTSAAAATYVANKAALKNPPLISGLSPPRPVAGQPVDILGANLVPAPSDRTVTETTVVLVQGKDEAAPRVQPATAATATKTTFAMPADYGSGTTIRIRVVTTANATTPPYTAEVA